MARTAVAALNPDDAPVLPVQRQRALWVQDRDGAPPRPLCAASGLVLWGSRAFVVADDQLQLARFDLDAPTAPGRTSPLFDGALPDAPAARKAAKPDVESLLHLPPSAAPPHGALLALGSGSRPTRFRGAQVALGPAGDPQGPPQAIDLHPWFDPWMPGVREPNVEGAFLLGQQLVLLQRRNGRAGTNATVTWAWPPVPGSAPGVQLWDLGTLAGVPLGFTDGCALPDGGWLFSAAAEDTDDAYQDGRCTGSVLGRVGPDGALQALWRLSLTAKVEGVAVQAQGAGWRVWMVTDADDPTQAAALLTVDLPG